MNSSGRQTACFRYGWAWGSPELPPDGLRGVGVTDLETRTTRAVGVAIPPRVLRQMNEVSARNPFRWLFYRFLARKLSDPKPSEYRFEQGSAWYRTPPGEEWLPLDSVPDPAAPIDELALGAIAIPAKRSGYTGEPMWNVIDVTELGCELDEPDLWANWAAIKPSQIV
jgi:hypothetical protein